MNRGGGGPEPLDIHKFFKGGRYLNNEYGVNIDGETVISHILWADDMILLSNMKKGLQNHLNKLYQYCSRFFVFGGFNASATARVISRR